jgi:RND family efflux transporter MFP subunit
VNSHSLRVLSAPRLLAALLPTLLGEEAKLARAQAIAQYHLADAGVQRARCRFHCTLPAPLTMNSTSTSMRRSIRNVCSLLCAFAVAACGSTKANETVSAPPAMVLSAADVVAATSADIGSTVVVSGALDPADVVRVRAQVAGTIRDLRVDRGSKVSRGQALARVEAQGVTSQAEGAKANVASAEAALALARQRLDAGKRLFAVGATSQIDLKSAEAGYDAAVAQVAAAQAMSVSAGEAAARTSLRSPLDGWVSERNVEDGESVKAEDPVLTVVDTRMLELKGQVGAVDAARVRAGQKVTFTLDAMPGQAFDGTVARVDPVANAATRQVGVFVQLPNAAGKIVAGQFAHGRIHTGATARAIVVPFGALRAGEKESYVLVVEGNVVHRRVVVPGVRDEDTGVVVVASGLKAGERVIVTSGVEIADGTTIAAPKEK